MTYNIHIMSLVREAGEIEHSILQSYVASVSESLIIL